MYHIGQAQLYYSPYICLEIFKEIMQQSSEIYKNIKKLILAIMIRLCKINREKWYQSLMNYYFFFWNSFIYLFIYFWLCWVFVSVRGLSPAVASGGHSSSRCAGLSLSRPLLLRSTGSRCAGSVVVAHGPSCSVACGIFPDQGSNQCPLALAGRFSTTAPPGKPAYESL